MQTLKGQTPEMTAADVEAFLDGLVPLQIKQADIVGATIAVVKSFSCSISFSLPHCLVLQCTA